MSKWKSSGYNRWTKPSVDRLDDNLGYSFDNIQLMTWKENNEKQHQRVLSGQYKKTNSKRVNKIDLITGEILDTFVSAAAASRSIGDLKYSLCSAITKNRSENYKGFKWEYEI